MPASLRPSLRGVFAALVLPAALAAQAPDAATVQPGDSVRLTVWQRADLSGQFAVEPDGSLSHPLLRETRVAGVPRAQAEGQLRTFLQRFGSNPQFVYEPLLRVAVSGEVRAPRLLSAPPVVTIADAVALAGGGTDRANLKRAELFRGGRTTVVDLTRPAEGAAAELIRSGDRIVVPARGTSVREYIAPVASVAAVLLGIYNAFSVSSR
jgi:polysaccharide export outer membrane protein